MKHALFALFITIQILLAAGISQAQPYQTINTENSIAGENLSRTVTTIQSGANPLNRFFMTRVVKAGVPNEGLQGVILLLPPLGSGFQNYEAAQNGDYNNSFVAFFARRNFAVVGYSPRQQGLTAGSCESGAIDCSPMADWGLQTIVNDVAFIRQQIATQYPELNANFCSAFDAMLAGGVVYDGQSGPAVKGLNQLSQVAPNAPVVFPGFPQGSRIIRRLLLQKPFK